MAPTGSGPYHVAPGPPVSSSINTGPPYPDHSHRAASMQGDHQPPNLPGPLRVYVTIHYIAFNTSIPYSRPPGIWPPSCGQKQGPAKQYAENDGYSQTLESTSHDNELSRWIGLAPTQNSSNVTRGRYIQRQPPHVGCEDRAAIAPDEPFIKSRQAHDTGLNRDLLSTGLYHSGASNGHPPTYDQPYDVYYDKSYHKAIASQRTTLHGLDPPHLAKEGPRPTHQQSRPLVPPLVESMSEHNIRPYRG
ncbi:uncharacterized protein LY79DRAFT_675861 [Colletotrichum navitas]|uniref:Uncharacterized protein n=1 Tax=Colletotrichum navitas TaxID=681940 RepID=A0AAD8QCJ4_9PEZI|nr:uncharacterized protein LY79DRAFT_675861 [Colletotrichum navitas]KAK1599935.1 hypothetical protein LY79DRAFT_675861 [Colletotrichum navitas]